MNACRSKRRERVPPDVSNWLNQIETKRRELMLTIRSGKQTPALALLGNDVDASVQDVLDEIIDTHSSEVAHV